MYIKAFILIPQIFPNLIGEDKDDGEELAKN